MPVRASRIALRELRTLFNQGAIGDLTDGQLLERFATHDPESAELAFAALVERHGPMVLRVCRSALCDRHDADDAFQATFLILVQKSRSLWIKDSLGPWLHRVAHRVATRARHSKARRREHERHFAVMRPAIAVARVSEDEIAAILHQEIDRLPDRHRIPVVICDLQGLTHEKAARHLGWPVGTVKSRLGRAREILRNRLTRRGLGPPCTPLLLGKGLSGTLRTVEVVLPSSLAESTVGAAAALAAGKAAVAITAPITILIAEGLKSMFMNKLRIAAIAIFSVGAAAATTVGVLAQSGAHPERKPVGYFYPSGAKDAARDQSGQSPAAPESVPSYITQSRAMIVTRLEEELAQARARLDRTLNKVRSPDDPAAAHARKTVEALNQVLARIDTVLVDAVEAYPTMFDFSGGPGVVSSKNQSIGQPIDRTAGAINDPRARDLLDTELSKAWERWKWASDMFSRGYVSKSVVDQARENVDRLINSDRMERTNSMMGVLRNVRGGGPQQPSNDQPQSSSGPMGMMGSMNMLTDGPGRRGTDVRGVMRQRQQANNRQGTNQSQQPQREQNRPQAGQGQSQNQGTQAMPEQNQPQEQSQQPNSAQSQTGEQGQQPYSGQGQPHEQSQQQSAGNKPSEKDSGSNGQPLGDRDRARDNRANDPPNAGDNSSVGDRANPGGNAAPKDQANGSSQAGQDQAHDRPTDPNRTGHAESEAKQKDKPGQSGQPRHSD
jgi:RNA polymerase sigma factor (sigma-70 family)